MHKNIPWIIAGVVVAGGLTWLVYYKPVAPKKVVMPPAPGAGGIAGGTIPVSGGPTTGVAAPTGVPGSNVYSKAGLTIRSSPKINNGFLGLFDNIIATISDAGTFVGNIVSATLDSNSDQDPSGNIYTWYLINPAPGYGYPGGGSYYVREDYITVK